MFGLLSQRARYSVGVELGSARGTLAVFERGSRRITQLLRLSANDVIAGQEQAALLEDLFDKAKGLKPRGMDCTVTLAPDAYDLLLIDAPRVPDAEIAQALRWQLKDMATIPLNEAEIGYIRAQHLGTSDAPMLFVALTRTSMVDAIAQAARRAKLTLRAVIPPEFAVRNLLAASASFGTEPCIGALMLYGRSANIVFLRDKHLCMARKFALRAPARDAVDLPIDVLQAEISRSFNYLQRQLRQPSPTHLFVGGDVANASQLARDLAEELQIPVTALTADSFFSTSKEIEGAEGTVASLALGAALEGMTE